MKPITAADSTLGLSDPAGVRLRYRGETSLPGLPRRADFVDQAAKEEIARKLGARSAVRFMPTDVVEPFGVYKDGRPVYAIRVFGCLEDGSKAEVTIMDIQPYFDVRVVEPWDAKQFADTILTIAETKDIRVDKIETIKAFPGRGYYPEPQDYIRVATYTLGDRKDLLKAVSEAGHETASDDVSSYYRKAARELGLPLSGWAVLSGYTHTGPTSRSPLCGHVFRVPHTGYRPMVDSMGDKKDRDEGERVKAGEPLLARDRTLVLAWDIETRTLRPGGDLPLPEHKEDSIFMISAVIFWKDQTAPLAAVCITDVEIAADSRWTTVICDSSPSIIQAFALCFQAMAPDIVIGFNDSEYDWPFLVEKADQYGILAPVSEVMTASPWGKTTGDNVRKWNYRYQQKIKISPEEQMKCSYLKLPGYVSIDIRVCFKKLYPKAETTRESSLNFYLTIEKLPKKAELSTTQMWKYYNRAVAVRESPDIFNPAELAESAEWMREVAYYCVTDAARCQELAVRRAVVNDYREVSALAFVPISDTHYYAGGMRVRNLIGAAASRRGMVVSMKPRATIREPGKYPGAFVYPPVKGIIPDPVRLSAVERAAIPLRAGNATPDEVKAFEAALRDFSGDRPLAALDFASLYPSLIMTYNLSPDKTILDPVVADYWRERGRELHKIEFQFNGRQVVGWTVRDRDPKGMGCYGAVLRDLFERRAAMKAQLAVAADTKELIELVRSRKEDSLLAALIAVKAEAQATLDRAQAMCAPDAKVDVAPGGTREDEIAYQMRLARVSTSQLAKIEMLFTSLETKGAEVSNSQVEQVLTNVYDKACFDWACLNSKQTALKQYMNTFYGEAGNADSPFFMLPIAGGVTSAGKYNLMQVADYVIKKGFIVKYGDTDSLYIVPSSSYFAECDHEYASGRLDRVGWMHAMVRVSMRAMNTIRDEVNAFLKADNGASFLKMEYEEVLYPVVLTGKKKYYGIPHVAVVNSKPHKLFVRGMEVIKQGQPGYTRTIGNRIMWASASFENVRTLRRIVEDELLSAICSPEQWKFEDFIRSDAWRPAKNNIPVQRFVARMRVLHASEVKENDLRRSRGEQPLPLMYTIPEEGERFKYIIAKIGSDHDIKGYKNTLKKGDLMTYAHVAKARGIPIDVSFYLVHYVIGQCARFICGDAMFQPIEASSDEKYSLDRAKKHLEVYVKSLQSIDAKTSNKRGHAYRRAYKRANGAAYQALYEFAGLGALALDGDNLTLDMYLAEPQTPAEFVNKAMAEAKRSADRLRGLRPYAPVSRLPAVYEMRVRELIGELYPKMRDLALMYNATIDALVYGYRRLEHDQHPELGPLDVCADAPPLSSITLPFAADDALVIRKMYDTWHQAVSVCIVQGWA